jgi:hypothetical protein
VIVVLDTNVWISAPNLEVHPIERSSPPSRKTGSQSPALRAEIERVLTQKFDRDPVELQIVLDELLAQPLRIKAGLVARRG